MFLEKTEQEVYNLILKIARDDERIRAVYIHGSRANPNAEIDIYSDYDVVFVVTEIHSFVENKNWIHIFGDIAFVFEGLKNENMFFEKEINDLSRFYVWCMLLKDGNRIDLLLETKDEAMRSKFTANKRTVILLDKDGCLPENIPASAEDTFIEKPTEEKYTACCAGFWWFLNDVAKAIARDQLLDAKEMFHATIRLTLNQMINWHIGTQTDFAVSIGTRDRYFEAYLSEDLYTLYKKTYSDSDYSNFWSAIFSACELFGKTAPMVGDYFGFAYDKQGEINIMDYLEKIRCTE